MLEYAQRQDINIQNHLGRSAHDVIYAQIAAPQWLKIANDSANLVNTTVNISVFENRYDLLLSVTACMALVQHNVTVLRSLCSTYAAAHCRYFALHSALLRPDDPRGAKAEDAKGTESKAGKLLSGYADVL